MKTRVGLQEDRRRAKPWAVYWFDPPDEDRKQRKRTRSFRYKREAMGFQAEKQAEINRGIRPELAEDVTVGRLLEEFKERRLTTLSYSSQKCYQTTMEQFSDYFGSNRKVQAIDRGKAEAFMATRKRVRSGVGKLASWTLFQHLKHARAIFNAAIEWGYLHRNPFSPSKGANTKSPLRVKAKSRPWQHITPEEFWKLLMVIPNARRRACYWLMYGCGLRAGELYNLTVDRIDLDQRQVHLENRAPSPKAPPFTVKADGESRGSKARTVPIPKIAIPDIAEAMREAFKSGGFISLSPKRYAWMRENWALCREGKPWARRKEWRPWQNRDMMNNLLRDTKTYFRKAGVELTAPFTLHTFRKSFAQNHADNATPPKTLAELMGHSKVSITLEFYNRTSDANRLAAANTMDQLLFAKPDRAKAVGE